MPIKEVEFNNEIQINSVKITFIPAGHVLGSSQIKIDNGSEVTIITGDYKRAIDPTCKAFEVHECDTFVTEATFASPNLANNGPKTSIDALIVFTRSYGAKLLFIVETSKLMLISSSIVVVSPI